MVDNVFEAFGLNKTSQVILGIILIVTGLLFVIAGKILIRVVAAVSVAVAFWVSGYAISMLVAGKDHPVSTVALVLCGIAALLGGIVGLFLFKAAIVVVGALTGLLASVFLFGTVLASVKSAAVVYIVAAIMTVCFGVATFFAFNYLLVTFTAFLGSLSFMMGVDIFTKTGLNAYLFSLRSASEVVVPNSRIIAMLVSILVLAAIGIIVQVKFFSKPQKKKVPASSIPGYDPVPDRSSMDSVRVNY